MPPCLPNIQKKKKSRKKVIEWQVPMDVETRPLNDCDDIMRQSVSIASNVATEVRVKS